MTDLERPIEPATLAEALADFRFLSGESWDLMLRELGDLDRGVYRAIAETPTPTIDDLLRHLSDAASYSKLWIAIAAGLAAVGGRSGRRTAVTALVGIGVTSGVVNQGMKRLLPRNRPDRDGADVPDARQAKMPESTSFPSGHSASGFAFATIVGADFPLTGAALRLLAAAVAYSRVHTGVHYPGDALIGSVVGASIGSAVATAARRVA